MKNIFVIVLLSFVVFISCKQTKDIQKTMESAEVIQSKKEVQKAVMTMFDGMRAGDSSMVSSVFMNDVKMFTSFNNKKGEAVFREGDLQGFLKAVGTPHDEVWNEVIHSFEIEVEDNLAQVWTPYSFFLGEKFVHCGVNAFHLTKTLQGWKIFHLADTRKRKGCIEEVKD